MNILALETGGAHWGAACVAFDARRGEAELVSFRSSEQPRELSQQLFSVVQSTLSAASWSLDDVDALTIGLGPGSWTGLRIGLSAAKTLAQARGWQLIGVPSLSSLAQATWRAHRQDTSTLLLATEKCRPGEIYAKIYEAGYETKGDFLAVVRNEWIGTIELVADELKAEALSLRREAPYLLCGGAAQAVADLLQSRGEEYAILAPPFEKVLLELAVIGAYKIESDEADDPPTLQPLYLAPSNAERNLLARRQ